MRIDRIVTRHMDWGAGVLKGIRSHAALAHLAPRDVEAAIANIQGAARAIERQQRELFRKKTAQAARRRRAKKSRRG